MIPGFLRPTWTRIQRLEKKGDATGVKDLLEHGILHARLEAVRSMASELEKLIASKLLRPFQAEILRKLDESVGYSLFGPGFTTEVVRKNDVAVRYTRNAKGEIVAACMLSGTRPRKPFLHLNPARKAGEIEFKSTFDSFAKGRASASTAYADDTYEASMTYVRWRNSYLRWFEEVLAEA